MTIAWTSDAESATSRYRWPEWWVLPARSPRRTCNRRCWRESNGERRKSGLGSRISLCEVGVSGIHFEGIFDLVLAFWMVHEVPDQALALGQVRRALKPEGRLFMVEPKGHVTRAAFDRTVQGAQEAGLTEVRRQRVSSSRAILMANGGAGPPECCLHGVAKADDAHLPHHLRA